MSLPAAAARIAELSDLAARLAPDPVGLAILVSLLPVEALLAVRVGAEVAFGRADRQLDEWLNDSWAGGRWYRQHPLVYATVLQRRRYPPDGNRERWIRDGPASLPGEDGRRGRGPAGAPAATTTTRTGRRKATPPGRQKGTGAA